VAVRDRHGNWGRARRVSAGGTSVTAPVPKWTSRGEVIVAWTQSAHRRTAPLSGPNDVRVAIRSRGGRWDRPVALGRTRHFIAAGVDVATGPHGSAAIVWLGTRTAGGDAPDDLRLARRPAGGRFERGRSLGERGTDQQVAFDHAGHVLVAWTRAVPPDYLRSRIRLVTTHVTGRIARPRTLAGGHAGGPALTPLPDGSVVLAWRSDQTGLGATRAGLPTVSVRSPGGIWGAATVLSDVRARRVYAGTSTSGETLLAWFRAPSARQQGSALYAAWRSPEGAFGAPSVLQGPPEGPVAVLGDGTALTVGAGGGILAAIRAPGGAFAAAARITRTGELPTLAAHGSTGVAVWVVGDRLRYSTITA
jgi:hypothetical protein